MDSWVGSAGGPGFAPALTRFVGRAGEIDELARLLLTQRLVTITGPGGVGKTRLAAEVTRRVSNRFDDRVWLVELAPISTPNQVAAVIGARVGVQQQYGRSTVQAVADILAAAPTLLILDNCEHVVDAVAEFGADLLTRCDDLVILATSRERLGVSGEARLRLSPLPTEPRAASGARDADAVVLFLDRVRLADPTFEPSGESATLLPKIVARLDGLPLAIELAAARVESLGLQQLSERLGEPLQVLTQGSRTAPERHRSLRATVNWSYQLMTDQLRRVFRRLAILPGPFTLQAAEAVAGGAAEASVWQLVDTSLLTPPRAGPDGRTRYLMLATVRAFARARLDECGERDEAESAYIQFAVHLASSAAAEMHTAGGEAAGACELDADEVLLREALSLALERDPNSALRLAVALAPWWQLRGRALSGYPQLERALHASATRDDVWFTARTWLGRLAHSTAAYGRALTQFDASCASLADKPRSPHLVDGLAGRSASLRNLGRLGEAESAARTALQTARDIDYPEGEATALTQLCLIANYADDPETATAWARQAAQLDATRLPDRVARRVRVILTVALADSNQPETAQEICAAGLVSARAAGDVLMQADFLSFTTRIALRLGQIDHAGAHVVEALRLTARSGDSIRVLDCLDDCARLCELTGRPADAITLWAAREAGATALGTPSLPQDVRYRQEPLDRARRRLGPDAVRAAEHRGIQMNLSTATDFAVLLASSKAPEQSAAAESTGLTPREKELLALVAQGRTDAQIADELFISIRTVRSHLDRIRDKSGSRRRADLTMLALRAGVV